MSQPSADRESLQALLARVHERLNEAGAVDADSREMLGQVMGDIERALGSGAAAPQSSRLESLAVKFEADHPDLAAILRRLNNLLGNAGI